MGWSLSDVPDLRGRRILVTGANSGIGLGAVELLASKGATVIMACRTPEKAEKAAERVRAFAPGAELEITQLDLASLDSVRRCAEAAGASGVDVLVNNAGVMALPEQKTADGFEIQLGTNHMGHFALTGLLLPHLLRSSHGRVVTVGSVAHFFGKIPFDDLDADKSYSPWGRYASSKLANMLFLHEFTRRVAASGASLLTAGCHPGYANTNINRAGAAMKGATFTERLMANANLYLAQSTHMGALPTVYAATGDDVEPGGYYGPDGLFSLIGSVGPCRRHRRAEDANAAARLWETSVARTGVDYASLG